MASVRSMDDSDARRDGKGDERALFEEAMREVQPLADRSGPAAPPPRRRPIRRRPGTARVARDARFDVEITGERLRGRIPGFDLRQVRRLETGELAPELTVDLHGFARVEARGILRDAFRQARRAGFRTVQVIHGRGLGSEEGPVLKAALPGWLAEPPLGTWVLAFASAPPPLGGPGATLVLLRKPNSRGGSGR